MDGSSGLTARSGASAVQARSRKGVRDAGMEEVRGFAPNPGGLRMLVHRPEGLAAGAPLVVVLHGCTQGAGAHAAAGGWLELADRFGFGVLAPEQTAPNNPNRCFNWFEPGDTARDLGEGASIVAMVRWALSAYGLDPARVFVTGLSAGGAMASALLAVYPDVFAGGAIVAGLPYGVAGNVGDAMMAMQAGRGAKLAPRPEFTLPVGAPGSPAPRVAIWHGQADMTVSNINGLNSARQWAAAHGRPGEPDEVEVSPTLTRSTWRSAEGEPVVVYSLVNGLGHGVPLSAGGGDPIGHIAPFMLEAGVSSTAEIAEFWGLAPAGFAEAVHARGAASAGPSVGASGLGGRVMASLGAVSTDVRGVIEAALQSAGLLK